MSQSRSFIAPAQSRWQAWLLLPIIALGGCGYHWSNMGPGAASSDPEFKWPSLYREDVKTVAVPVFTNRTYYRGVEFNLTKAVVNQIETRTPYKVVPREQADTVLEGNIVDCAVHYQSRSAINGLPQEQLFYLVVSFTWKDLRTGKILVMRNGFEQTSSYYPTLGEDRFEGSQDSVERLALAIVDELQANWGNTDTTQPTTR